MVGITHSQVATYADQVGAEINKAEWNDNHVVTDDAFTIAKTAGLQAALDSRTSMKQVELDFGSLPLSSSSFIISDTSITATSLVTAQVAYDAPTGKELDEIEMDEFSIKCGQNNAGVGFSMFMNATDGSLLAGTFLVNYTVVYE
jgi:hypothetical protein